jgi:two-component system sensor histidine kinase UhpB
LTNVFRHAGATRVEIMVEPALSRQSRTAPVESEAIIVSVRDNGAGLPPDHKQGFGLTGMRERVMALGGTMTVLSTNQGVTVEALVPNGTPQFHTVEPL